MRAEVPTPVAVACPKCGSPQPVKPVTVIGPRDAAALERLFKGALNRFSCVSCKVSFRVDLPLLYRDDTRRVLLYLAPPEADALHGQTRAEDQLELIIQNVSTAKTEESTPAPMYRLVRVRAELVEKIAILRAGLDDRLVEFVKYQFFLRREQALDPQRKELYYDFSATGKEKLAFVVFDRMSGKAESAAHLPMDVYRELAAAFLTSDDLQEELQKLFPGYVVNAASLF